MKYKQDFLCERRDMLGNGGKEKAHTSTANS